tara:strand:- start:15424 stop:15684 length:261 start_codon:yes stop_codon:yes gene_type:complete
MIDFMGDLGKIYKVLKTGAEIYSTVKSKRKEREPTPLIEEPSLGGMFELSSSGMEQARGPKAPDVTNYEEVLNAWLQRISRFAMRS